MNDVIEKYYINDEEINASTYQRALEKVLDWNGISVTTK